MIQSPTKVRRLTLGLYVSAFVAIMALAAEAPLPIMALIAVLGLPYSGYCIWQLLGNAVTNHKREF